MFFLNPIDLYHVVWSIDKARHANITLTATASTMSGIGRLIGMSRSIPPSATTSLLDGLRNSNYSILFVPCAFVYTIRSHPPSILKRLLPKQYRGCLWYRVWPPVYNFGLAPSWVRYAGLRPKPCCWRRLSGANPKSNDICILDMRVFRSISHNRFPHIRNVFFTFSHTHLHSIKAIKIFTEMVGHTRHFLKQRLLLLICCPCLLTNITNILGKIAPTEKKVVVLFSLNWLIPCSISVINRLISSNNLTLTQGVSDYQKNHNNFYKFLNKFCGKLLIPGRTWGFHWKGYIERSN